MYLFKIGDEIKILDEEILDVENDRNNIYVIEDIKVLHIHLRRKSRELLTYPNHMMLQKAVVFVSSSEITDAFETDGDVLKKF
jgi:MscS family membrane protein